MFLIRQPAADQRGQNNDGGRRLILWAAASMVAASGLGCSMSNVVKTPSPVNEQPTADEATEYRQYSRSLALVHSGATQAWPTRWYYAPNPDNTTIENFGLDPVMALVQTISLPVTVIPDYPFRPVVYAGDVVPLSYNAMPPLPPVSAVSAANPDPDPLVAQPPSVLPPPPLPSMQSEVPPMILPPPETKPSAKPVEKASVKPSGATTQPAQH